MSPALGLRRGPPPRTLILGAMGRPYVGRGILDAPDSRRFFRNIAKTSKIKVEMQPTLIYND